MFLFLILDAGSNFGRLGLNSKSSHARHRLKNLGLVPPQESAAEWREVNKKYLNAKKRWNLKKNVKTINRTIYYETIWKQNRNLMPPVFNSLRHQRCILIFFNLRRIKQMALTRKTILKHSFTVRPRFSIEISAWPVTAAAQAHKWCVLWSSQGKYKLVWLRSLDLKGYLRE